MKCPACQNEVNVDSIYCPKCGEKLEQAAEQAPAAASAPQPDAEESGQGAEEQPAGEEARPTASERLMERAREGGAQTPAAEPVSGWSKGGYSPKALNARFLATCLVTAALLALVVWLWWGESGWWKWAGYASIVVIAALWIWYLCVRIYRVGTIKYELTTHQFYHEVGIFRRVRDVIEVIDIDDLKLERTLWDRVVNGGVGTVVIRSADPSNPELRLVGLVNPDEVFHALDNARRKERVARGLKSV